MNQSVSQSAEGVLGALKRTEIPFSAALFNILHESVTAIESILFTDKHAGPPLPKKDFFELIKKLGDIENTSLPISSEHINHQHDDQQDSLKINRAFANPPLSTPENHENQENNHLNHTPQTSDNVRVSTQKLDDILLKADEFISLKLTGHQQLIELRQINKMLDSGKTQWLASKTQWRILQKTLAPNSVPASAQFASKTDNTAKEKTDQFLMWNEEHNKTLDRELKATLKTMEQNQRVLTRMVDDLLDSIKQLIMLPCHTFFSGYPRMVREIAREQEKSVELKIFGEEIEIDRRILDEMQAPITHLLRNAIDHGIESPAERVRLAKPAQGTIDFSVAQIDGDKIEMTITDDGRGIDINQVKASAIKTAILSQDEAGELDDQNALRLILQSGITTSPLITELSGRGLGMAIVWEQVEKLGGNLRIDSTPQQGTTIRIKLPISVATCRGIIVEICKQMFVIPNTKMVGVLKTRRDTIKMVENRATLTYQEKPLSLVSLEQILGLSKPQNQTEQQDWIKVVILGSRDQQIGFLVDEIFGEQEILIKGMGKQLQRVRNLAGTTILGTGRIVPILDVADLIDAASTTTPDLDPNMADNADLAKTPRSILVVEDSITSRMLLKNILQAQGYLVRTAVDGLDGLTMLKTAPVDLVVCDIEMPRMDGFELTEKIRADSAFSDLPLVLVTSLGSRENRERGIDVGANAYIVKSDFDQTNLLEVIERLI